MIRAPLASFLRASSILARPEAVPIHRQYDNTLPVSTGRLAFIATANAVLSIVTFLSCVLLVLVIGRDAGFWLIGLYIAAIILFGVLQDLHKSALRLLLPHNLRWRRGRR